MKKLSNILPALIPFVILMFLCEFLVRAQIVPSYLMASPTEVLQTMLTEKTALFQAMSETLGCSMIGLILSAFSGILGGLLVTRYQVLQKSVTPYAVFFQTVPIVAIAPLLVIWFGFGFKTVIASSWIVSFFPVLASTVAGLKSTDPQMLDLFRLYGATPWKTTLALRLPWATLQIFTGLRIAAGLAVIGAIVGEFVAGGGLGSLIDSARTQQRIDIVFGAVFLSTACGFLVILCVDILKQRFIYGRKSE